MIRMGGDCLRAPPPASWSRPVAMRPLCGWRGHGAMRNALPCVRARALRARQVMTYGLENNDQPSLERQSELGVAAAIVDEVEAVTKVYSARQ